MIHKLSYGTSDMLIHVNFRKKEITLQQQEMTAIVLYGIQILLYQQMKQSIKKRIFAKVDID
jgi:hypothetical protein